MLSVSHLRKEYATLVAVEDVSLRVERGQILGLLGPNGAGKTTTIRMILGILLPDRGEVFFEGKPFSRQMLGSVGYLPEERGLYRKNKLLHTIVYFAVLKGVPRAEAERRAKSWLERLDLARYTDRKVEELSRGNQQKVQFIISLLHDPPLLILDEPFSGLDPVNQNFLKEILLELKNAGRAIIFSTHVMEHAEKLCEAITLINRGRVVLEGDLRSIKRRFGKNSLRLEFDGDGSILMHLPSVKSAHVSEQSAELILKENVTPNDVIAQILPHMEIRKIEREEASLTSIFLEVVGGSSAAPATLQEEKAP